MTDQPKPSRDQDSIDAEVAELGRRIDRLNNCVAILKAMTPAELAEVNALLGVWRKTIEQVTVDIAMAALVEAIIKVRGADAFGQGVKSESAKWLN